LSQKKVYAVKIGKKPGIYQQWEGEDGAAAQVQGFPGAKYKGFAKLEDAQNWLDGSTGESHDDRLDSIIRLYTDGSCIVNPGPGGYGVVIKHGKHRQELSAGFRHTTNNRMELRACIAGLKSLKGHQSVEIYSDSSYLVNAMTKGWAARWQANGWMRNRREKAENSDLWAELLNLTEKHTVTFHWVRGHAGHPENERVDQLAQQAANRPNLPPDPGCTP
jgi:ribonuclease HI